MTRRRTTNMGSDMMRIGVGTMMGVGAIGMISNMPGMSEQGKAMGNLAMTGVMLGGAMQMADSIGGGFSSRKTKRLSWGNMI